MGVLRELHKGELTIKDMSTLREDRSARDQHKINSGSLREFSLNHNVSMGWKVGVDRLLRPFTLSIDGHGYSLSWSELKEMDTAGFFRREEGNPKGYRLRQLDGPQVSIDVELNEEAQRDMIFRLKADGKECYIDWYQMLRLGRFI